MTLRRAVLWITGRDLLKPQIVVTVPHTWHGIPEPNWKLTLSSDRSFEITVPNGPNCLHRLAQRIILGFRWRML